MNPRKYSHESRVVPPFLRWIVPVAVILLTVAGSGDSVGSEPTTSTGVNVTKSVPFVRESIDEIRALAPLQTRAVPENRVIPLHRIPRRSGTTGDSRLPLAGPALEPPFLASSPAPSAPALDSSFAGLGNPPHSEGDVIPPDTMGAVGPNHLVSLMNSDFAVFDKTTGAVLQKMPLESFWGSLGTAAGEPGHFPFDPKILYDQHSGRFVAITLGGTSAPNSWVMIAVSSTSNPLDNWVKWAIDADKDNDVQQFNNWADFPGLGADAFNVYVTANMFNGIGGQYSKVWVIPKAQLSAGSNPITWFEFRNPPGSDFTMQPAHTFGTATAEYFLFEGSVNHLGVAWMDNVSGTPIWHFPLQVPVTSYTSTSFLPGAPQSGDANTIDTSDTRLLNAVYRNGSLWAAHTVQGPTTKTEVAWYRINPGAGAVLAQGRISDPARWYYYPSIAVNKDNIAAVGFSGSSTTEYVGGYYTLIPPSTGTAEPVTLLKPGEAPYYKTGQTMGIPGGRTENRWGDFSATVVDPTDDTSFWTLQEYAMTHDTFIDINNNVVDRSRWGTWWGKFHPSDVLSPTGLTATADSATQVTLRWTDLATNETGYFVERKVGAEGTFGILTSPPLPPNRVTYTDNVGLIGGTTYYYRVGAVGSTGTSYSIEVSVTTPGSPPSSGGGGGGGCLSITRSGGEVPFGTSLFSVGILLLPACALGLRRFFRRRERTVPIRHLLC